MMCSYKEFKWKHLCEKCESFHVNVTKRIRVIYKNYDIKYSNLVYIFTKHYIGKLPIQNFF